MHVGSAAEIGGQSCYCFKSNQKEAKNAGRNKEGKTSRTEQCVHYELIILYGVSVEVLCFLNSGTELACLGSYTWCIPMLASLSVPLPSVLFLGLRF